MVQQQERDDAKSDSVLPMGESGSRMPEGNSDRALCRMVFF